MGPVSRPQLNKDPARRVRLDEDPVGPDAPELYAPGGQSGDGLVQVIDLEGQQTKALAVLPQHLRVGGVVPRRRDELHERPVRLQEKRDRDPVVRIVHPMAQGQAKPGPGLDTLLDVANQQHHVVEFLQRHEPYPSWL